MRPIDADALIKTLGIGDMPIRLTYEINNAPTVETVPVRHAKWTRENNYGIWKCSECGCKVNRVNPLKGNIWNYNYCPNCGARMDAKPTVDAVPVVRCKDCKYYLKSDEKCQLIDTRLHFYETDKRWAEGSFCSWAERKEE